MSKNDEKKYLLGKGQKSYSSVNVPDEDSKNESSKEKNFESEIRHSLGKTEPSEQTTYTWKNVNVWVGAEGNGKQNGLLDWGKRYCGSKPKNAESKQILKNVSGLARPGELTVIMGSSGAGKTTLLNVLTYRGNKGKMRISGEMAVNGVRVDPDTITSRSAYVQQDDLFIGTLTVREHLIFQALVRMHSHIPYKQRMRKVEDVIEELGLTKCADSLIGIPGRIKGISGGEMKRLSFASEVLTDPLLMFCDEPTSGLDSFMALNVVHVLKEMAQKGKTIVCTIHQPSSEVYAMFDQILLMAEGRTAFLGDSNNAIAFFKANGHPCPTNFNPADFFIQTLAIQPGNEEYSKKTIEQICDQYDKCESALKVQELTTVTEEESSFDYVDLKRKRSPYKASWMAQFRAVLWRSWISVIKEPMILKVRIFQTVVVSLLIGIIYFGQKLNQDGVMNINGALFLFLTNMTFSNIFAVINVFCVELPIFLREHFNGMYRTDVYFLSKTLAELPLYVFYPILFTSICYYMIGLNPEFQRFLVAVCIVTLTANAACSFGYMISCSCSSVSMALSVAPPFIIPFMLFGGFFLNKGSIPVYFVWLKYLSWFLYGNEALSINQWTGIESIECNRSNSTCPANGKIILDTLGFDESNFTFNITALASLIVAYRLIAFLALLSKTYRNNNH